MGVLHKDLLPPDLHAPGIHGSTHLPGGSDPIGTTGLAIVPATAEYSVAPADDFIFCTGTFSVHLPDATLAYKQVTIKNMGTGAITIICFGTQTADEQMSVLLNDKFESLTFVPVGNVWAII